MQIGATLLLTWLLLCSSEISSLPTALDETKCPDNCSCTVSTITCNGAIPDTVPPGCVDVVLLDPVDWPAGRFCDVNWTDVIEVSFIYTSRAFLRIQDYAFYCLSQIETFRIKHTYLSFNGNAFSGLTNVVVLDLSESDFLLRDLTNVFSVPSRLPKLVNLNVSRNRQIIHLDQEFINALSPRPIELLDFSKIEDLMVDFNDSSQLCEHLKTLLLHDSGINVNSISDGCKSLESVDLSGNPLLRTQLQQCVNIWMFLSIHTFFFAKTMYLNRLISGSDGGHLSNCSLSLGYSSSIVQKLSFSNNQIPAFEILFDISKLEQLELDHNNITKINKDAFIYLPSLLSINLAHNKLNEIQTMDETVELFRENKNLMTVDLSFNHLQCIPAGIFRLNSHLEQILLTGNVFLQLSIGFSHLSKLSVLDLRNNRISYLDASSRQKVDSFYMNHTNTELTIVLNGNPFSCGCQAFEFLQWFVTSPIFNSSYSCYLDGRYIPMTEAAIEASKGDCDRPKRRIRNILLSTLIPAAVVAITVATSIALYKRYKRKRRQRNLEERIRFIQDDKTGFTFTVFLSFCSLDQEFVVRQIHQPLEVWMFY